MKTYTVSLTVINSVEFISEKDLEHDICKEIFAEESPQYQNIVKVILPDVLKTTERIRRSISDITDNKGIKKENYYCISENETFKLEVLDDFTNSNKIQNAILSFIIDINRGFIRIGDNTTLGKGLCHIDIDKFQEQNNLSGMSSSLNQDFTLSRLEVQAQTITGILIRNRSDTSHAYTIDSKGNPIIPASSWKGIFRNTIKNWLLYYGESLSVLDQMFGNRNKGIKGCLIFYDSIIEDPVVIKETRSHIDKFTGATMTGGIKNQKYVSGNFRIVIECKEDISLYKKYLNRVLSDFQDKRINVGADFGIGKGLIEIDDIQWIDSKPPIRDFVFPDGSDSNNTKERISHVEAEPPKHGFFTNRTAIITALLVILLIPIIKNYNLVPNNPASASDSLNQTEAGTEMSSLAIVENMPISSIEDLPNIGYTSYNLDSITKSDFITITEPDNVYSFMYPDKVFYTGYYDSENKSYYLETYDGKMSLSITEEDARYKNDPAKCATTLLEESLKNYVKYKDLPYQYCSGQVADSGLSRSLIEGELKETGMFACQYTVSNSLKTYILQFTCESEGKAATGIIHTMKGYLSDCIYRGWSISGSTYKLRTVKQYMNGERGKKKDN